MPIWGTRGMNETLPIIGVLFFGFLCSNPAYARWEGKWDNKPLSELKMMDDDELIYEASDVCIRVNGTGKFHLQTKIDGSEYLLTIFRVVSKKHGGKAPQWMDDMLGATNKGDVKECVRVYSEFKKSEKKNIPKKAGKAETCLQELKILLDKGLITQEEYERKRAEILNEL